MKTQPEISIFEYDFLYLNASRNLQTLTRPLSVMVFSSRRSFVEKA